MAHRRPLISTDILQKYLEGSCSEQERQAVEAWYTGLTDNRGRLRPLTEQELDQLQAETYRLIREQLAPVPRSVRWPFALALRQWGWKMGVAATLVVGTWFLVRPDGRPAVGETVAAEATGSTSGTLGDIRFTNDKPRLVMHQLPDGSTVWMHAEATITYPRVFSERQRVVGFEGEGFFDVTSDPSRPFSIQSGDMRIEVLGTRFNVKAPPRQLIYEVSVVSGSVSVSAPDAAAARQKVVLAPQQQALFELKTRRLTSNTIPAEPKKEIYEPLTVRFESTPLDQAVQQLSRRYDVRLHLVNPAMKNCRLTADFEQQPLPAILEMLCATLDATYTMAGKTILIEGVPCD
jgi:transmembrane sensor